MNISAVLEQLGYEPHEVKIYLAALELGEATITEISHHTEIPRTTVSEVVEHMLQKGLLLSYAKKSHRYLVPQNPEKLLSNLRAHEVALESLLPQLVAMRRGSSHKPAVDIFIGISEIKKIMDDIIETKHHIAGLVSMDDWYNFFGEDYSSELVRSRVQHHLKMRMICPRNETALRLKANDERDLRHIKFLPSTANLRRITNFIYGDKMAIISFNRKKPMGIIIDDPDVAYGNLLYFENLWQHSSET